nr:uncharacterized protein LOC123762924 isoform X1 [Procambarus clarkii]XP_045605680.1 uncharacterized protein LOC123762924 isoform X1 [Procambarus clarkii]
MTKEFIDPPQGKEGVQWSSPQVGSGTCQNPEVSQSGARALAASDVDTPDDKEVYRINEEETVFSPSSGEHTPQLLSSSLPLAGTPVSLQLNSPLSSLHSSSPSLPSPVPGLSPTLSSPPPTFPPSPLHPYQRNTHISVEEFNERAMQDSENNNVDENSNDQQYEQYTNYHREFSYHQFVPDMSVRPRDRRLQNERDDTDHVPVNFEDNIRCTSRRSNRFSHRRNLSEDQTYSGTTTYAFEDSYSQLPNLNTPPAFAFAASSRVLPRLPNHNDSRNGYSDHLPYHHPREAALSHSSSRWHPLNLRDGGCEPLPLAPAPSEDITQGAQELLMNFTSDTLRSNHLAVPDSLILHQGFSNPTWSRAGQELRLLADTFAKTEERKRVQSMAETVNMRSINIENFFQLCTELFSDGITSERIVALFTFVGDVAVHQVRLRGEEFLQLLMKWSLKYLVDNVCRWVQEAGGWVAVLGQGANMVYRAAVCAFCIVGSLAAGLFIYKTLKDW